MSASNASCDSIKLFGKQRETALLAETAESDRLPHGIMLTGEKGIHDEKIAAMADRIIRMKDGRVVEDERL